MKIDGAFIRYLDQNDEDRLFVKAIVDVAHGLGKSTVAEFVENETIMGMLSDIGVDFAQGYYIGKPKKDLPPA